MIQSEFNKLIKNFNKKTFFQRYGSIFSALKVIRLLRLGRVVRKLDSYFQYGAASLVMLICVFVLVAHWFACIWYSIGYHEIKGPIEDRAEYGWLTYLDRISGRSCASQADDQDFTPECRHSAYITALYFAMTSITSIGFGNVAANTDLEKVFVTFMMLVGCKLL